MATITATPPKSDVSKLAPRRRSIKRLLAYILIGFLLLLAILAVVVAAQPSEFKVTRSATIAAPPAAVFAQVNDFHNWDVWSPWAKLDPNAKSAYEGPSLGKGAKFRWDGDENVGAGNMEIVDSHPEERIGIKLGFIRPFEGISDVEFLFKSVGNDQTEVTWTMAGENNFVAKAIGLVIDCDKMVGGQFEQGLANLKAVVETPPKQ